MKVTRGLIIFLLLCQKCMNNIVDATISARIVRFFCKRRILRRTRICQRIPCLDNIQTAVDLAVAFEQATTDLSGPATLIEICTERIIVPATDSEKTSISARTNVDVDQFGFIVQYKQIELRCAIKTETDPKGRCVLEASDGTGLFYLNNSTLNVTGFNLLNGGNVNHNSGGAMHISNSSTVNLTDMAFTNNEAIRGGAIYSNANETKPNKIIFNGADSTRQIGTNYNLEFIGNMAWSGGAIDASNTVISGSHVKFQQNVATRFGGGIHFNSGSYSVLNDSFFYNNYVAGDGGAIYAREKGVATFDRTKFYRNAARLQSGAIDVPGRYSVVLSDCEIYANVVNVSRRTLFEDYDKVQKPLDLYILGSLQNASAVRSLSVGGIVSINTTFSANTRLPLNTIAHLYVDGNGTAICKGTSFCGDRGLANTCDNKDFCTNCNQDDFSTIIELGEGVCSFNETEPPVTAPVPTPAPAPVPVPTPPPVPTTVPTRKCFESTNELRKAVKLYLNGDAKGTVKSMYGSPIGAWCIGNVTDFSYLFNAVIGDDSGYGCPTDFECCACIPLPNFNPKAEFFNEDISQWNTSSVTTMRYMFLRASAFNQDLGSWDVSAVTDMIGMFLGASAFNQALVSWDVSSANRMDAMFREADAFNQDVGSWNVKSVNDMSSMFAYTRDFNQDLSAWDVSNLGITTAMFAQAKAFNQDLGSWNVSKVYKMESMFYNASSFNQNLCPWKDKVSSEVSVAFMFRLTSCPNKNDPYSSGVASPFCYSC